MNSFKPFEQTIAGVSRRFPGTPMQEVVLMRLIEHVVKLLKDGQNGALERYGLNINGYMALLMMYASPENELNPCELSHSMDLSRTNITRLSDELVRKGLVARRHCEDDRRRIYLSLTEEGERLVVRALPEQREYYRSLWTVFSKEEMSQLEQLLRKLLVRLDQ